MSPIVCFCLNVLAPLVVLLVQPASQPAAAPAPVPAGSLISNGDFESGGDGWHSRDGGMSQLAPEAAHGGSMGLRVNDDSPENGSNYATTQVAATPGSTYELKCWARIMQGKDAAVHIQFFDNADKQINKSANNNEIKTRVKGEQWAQYTVRGKAPPEAVTVRVWIHTSKAGETIMDVDDVMLIEVK